MLPIFCVELQNIEADVPGAGIRNTVLSCRPASIGAELMTQFSSSFPNNENVCRGLGGRPSTQELNCPQRPIPQPQLFPLGHFWYSKEGSLGNNMLNENPSWWDKRKKLTFREARTV